MNQLKYLYAITMLIVGLELYPGIIQKTISIDYTEELIDDTIFTYRRDVVDGVVKQMWTVNGKETDQEGYDEAILVAEMAERRAERLKDYEKGMNKGNFQRKATRKCYEKLLRSLTSEIMEIIAKFDRYRLQPYAVFSKDTIAGPGDLEKIKSETIPLLQACLDDQRCFQELQDAYQTFKNYPDRLLACLHKTIYKAVDTVDDTKHLKELLALISEES